MQTISAHEETRPEGYEDFKRPLLHQLDARGDFDWDEFDFTDWGKYNETNYGPSDSKWRQNRRHYPSAEAAQPYVKLTRRLKRYPIKSLHGVGYQPRIADVPSRYIAPLGYKGELFGKGYDDG